MVKNVHTVNNVGLVTNGMTQLSAVCPWELNALTIQSGMGKRANVMQDTVLTTSSASNVKMGINLMVCSA